MNVNRGHLRLTKKVLSFVFALLLVCNLIVVDSYADAEDYMVEKEWVNIADTTGLPDVEVTLTGTNSATEEIEYDAEETIPNGYVLDEKSYDEKDRYWLFKNAKIPTSDYMVEKEWVNIADTTGLPDVEVTLTGTNSATEEYDAEEAVPVGYYLVEKTYDEYDRYWTFKNAKIPTTNFTVVKEWEGVMPGAELPDIEVTLTGTDSVTNEVVYTSTGTLTEANGWFYAFEDLPTQSAAGNSIEYDAEEIVPDGYISKKAFYEPNYLAFKNVKIPTSNYIVEKHWLDIADTAGLPDVEVTLTGTNSSTEEVVSTDTGMLTEANNWIYTFEDMPDLTPDGDPIEYDAEEIVPDGYFLYEKSYDEKDRYWLFKNAKIPTSDYTVEKKWVDIADTTGLPDVEVTLTGTNSATGDQVSTDTGTLTEANGWFYRFEDMPDFTPDGDPIVYDAEEIVPVGYVLNGKIPYQEKRHWIFENAKKPTTEFIVKKVWEGISDLTGLPDIDVILTGTNSVTGAEEHSETATLKDDNGWVHTFQDLPVLAADGNAIDYDADEIVPDGYELHNKVEGEGDFDVIFYNRPTKTTSTSITVEKDWLDIPLFVPLPDVEVNLVGTSTSSGAVVFDQSATLNAGNNWRHVFGGLSVTDTSGSAISYNATEVVPNGFYLQSTTYDPDTRTFKFVNASKLISVKVLKVWQGDSEASVNVKLLKNGVEIQQVTLSDGNNWQHVFTNLPKYESGALLTYTVVEEPLAGYTTQYSSLSGAELGGATLGFKITNTKRENPQPELISVKVMKAWQGGSEASVNVKLLKNGAEIQQAILSNGNNWQHVFTNLPKYESGALLTYTVVEEPLTGYTTQYSTLSGAELGGADIGYLITNIKDTVPPPETTSVKVVKEWRGNSESEVTIYLYRDGVEIDSTVLNAANSWTHTFDNLIKYNGTALYDYAVDEALLVGYDKVISEVAENSFVITNYMYEDDDDDDDDDEKEPQREPEDPEEPKKVTVKPEYEEPVVVPAEPTEETEVIILDVPVPLDVPVLPKTNEALPLVPQLLATAMLLMGAVFIKRD